MKQLSTEECFGCPSCILHENALNPPSFQSFQNYLLKERKVLLSSITHGEINFWRHKVKLATREDYLNPKIGLFLKGSHKIVDCSDCLAHHKKIKEAILCIKKAIKKFQIPIYNEKTRTGLIRYIQLEVGNTNGKIQLTFVINSLYIESRVKKFLDEVWRQKSDWNGIWINFQTSPNNVIFSDHWKCIKGKSFLLQKFSDLNVFFHPGSFCQAHISLFQQVLKDILKEVSSGAKVLELYAGVGVIGLYLAQKTDKVTLVESNPYSKLSFDKTIKEQPEEIQRKVKYNSLDVKNFEYFSEFDHILLDPPRKGIAKEILEKIVKENSIQKILYLSCNSKSFQRDEAVLSSHGFVLKNIYSYLLFPRSDHFEILGVFEKESG